MGEVVTPNYTQAQVLSVEGDSTPEVAAGDTSGDAAPADKQGTVAPGCIPKCLLEMWSSGTFRMGLS